LKFLSPIPIPKRGDASLLPALLSGSLLLMIGAQMTLPPPPAPDDVTSPAPRNLRLPLIPAPARLASILEAPLFTPSRTYDVDAMAGANAESNAATFALIGITRVRGNSRAFLKLANGDVKALKMGDSVKGWQLTWLGTDSARLSNAGQTMSLQAGVASTSRQGASEEQIQ
jgi:hypothetical protein